MSSKFGDRSGSRRQEILGEVHTDSFVDSGGKRLVFSRVSQLAERQRVFLVADRIAESRNDYCLELRLPPTVAVDGERPVVRVYRRDFSRREELLRRLYKRDPLELHGSVLLVEMRNSARTGVIWRRSLTRPVRHLRSLVAMSKGRCFAVITSKGESVGLELRPGAYFSLPRQDCTVVGSLAEGSAVRLVPGPGRTIQLRLAVESDHVYVPAAGRPVVVLPKNPLLAPGVAESELGKGFPFIVAGLPGIETAKQDDLRDAITLMFTLHPKIAIVQQMSQHRAKLAGTGQQILAGRVEVDSLRVTAAIVPEGAGRNELVPVDWAQLSFADTGARKIAESCERRWWSYHDTYTGEWVSIHDSIAEVSRPRRLPPVTASRGPVFFAPGWSLRYPREDLRRFGFPCSAVLDGLSEEISTEEQEYVIAAPITSPSGGIWVETFPGRVLELSGELLVLGTEDDYRPLAGLDWERFSTGDHVMLKLHEPVSGTKSDVPCIALTQWSPGPRGAFGGTRTLLPFVRKHQREFELILGRGHWQLAYPVAPPQLPTGNHKPTMWLNADNTLTALQDDNGPAAGDVVLLELASDGKFRVHGLPEWSAQLADSGWSASRWLYSALTTRDSTARLFGMLENALPMTVESVDGTVLKVSSRCQQSDHVESGSWIRGQISGLLTDRLVLIRSGASLLTIDIEHLVPGLPVALYAVAVAALVQDRRWHNFHADEHGDLRSGPATQDHDSGRGTTVQVVAKHVLSTPEGNQLGMLCAEYGNSGHRWLPAAELGWVPDLSENELTVLVQARRRTLACAVKPDGTVSVAEIDEFARRVGTLRPGSFVRIEVLAEREVKPGKLRRFLGCLYQTDLLVEFAPIRVATGQTTHPVNTEVTTCLHHPIRHLVVVDPGNRRTKLDLPEEMITLLQQSPRQVMTWSVNRAGTVDELLTNAVTAAEKADLRTALSAWLTQRGALAVGLADAGSLDMVAMLSASLALDELRESASTDPFGRLSVWLTWRAGLAALRSLHIEPLVVSWLHHPERLSSGRWQRLDQVRKELRVSLSQRELNVITSFCRGVLGRLPVLDEVELHEVARALLAAIGDLTPADGALPLDGPFGRISAFGRALTPACGELTAQPCLMAPQRKLITQVHRDVIADNFLLPLRPPLSALSATQRGEVAKLLEAVIKRCSAGS